MQIFDGILKFLVDNWQSFIVSLAASLVGTGLVALFLVWIYRVPNFDLHLDYIPGKMTDKVYSLPVFDISIVNKKRWLGFGNEEVLFGLFIPVDFIVNKKLFLVTAGGKEEWFVDTRGKDIFNIKNGRYFLYRGVVHLSVHPNSRTNFLRITGNFDEDASAKIYYYFETPYGRFPKFLKFGERIKKAEEGKLPYAEMKFN